MLQKQPCQIDAIVILPDHIHAIYTFPESDNNYTNRWRKIKSYFTQELLKKGYALKKNKRNEYSVWQRRFWEHTTRNEIDFENHVNYIHYNSVKHGLVKNVLDWPYSSFHRYVKQHLLPAHWGSGFINLIDMNYGE